MWQWGQKSAKSCPNETEIQEKRRPGAKIGKHPELKNNINRENLKMRSKRPYYLRN